MTLPKLAPLLFAILLGLGTSRAETYHGVRNEKCTASAEDAKAQIIERLGADKKLCDGIGGAVQIGGWSCHPGAGGCPKGKFRCNTQYRCARSVSVGSGEIPAPSVAPTTTALPPGAGFPTHPPTPFPTKPPVAATPFPTAPPTGAPSPVSVPTPMPTPAASATAPAPAATPMVPPNPNGGGPIPNPAVTFKPKVLTP